MKKLLKNKTIKYILKNKYLFMIAIAISTLFLGVGYAQISDIEFDVIGNATALAGKNVVITSIVYDSSENSDPDASTVDEPNLNLMSSHIVLGNSIPSSITYKVRIKNNTDMVAIFNKAAYISSSGHDNNDIEFVVNGLSHGDSISPGQRIECTITFKYVDSLATISNNILNSSVVFKFNIEDKVARIGNKYYDLLQDAITDAPSDVPTVIDLLKDTEEELTVPSDKNIEVLLRNNTISNAGNTQVLKNEGILIMRGGVIESSAAGYEAVNNKGGTITLDSMNIEVTGGKQAFYNEVGTATITGKSYFSTTSTQRGTVQNTANGTLTIESGTFISTGHNAVVNAGSLTVGIQDGAVTNASPKMIGRYYGISSEKYYNFYDGIAKGRTAGLNNTGRASGLEQGYEIVGSEETIGGYTYLINFPAIPAVVTFDPVNYDATVDEPTRKVAPGYKVGTFPEAVRPNYICSGWFTAPTGGEEVTPDTIINSDVTFYAHWTRTSGAASMGGAEYQTIQAAVNAAPDNTQTTITVLKDFQENEITISNTKNIILDLNGKTISNSTSKSIIENSGVLNIQNGTITSNSTTDGAINHNKGTLTISANVYQTGERQAIYIKAGTVNITGNPTLTSSAIGKGLNSQLGRSTVQCLSGATLNISGGTIIGNVQQAISSEGTLTIGSNNGSTNPEVPIIRGETYGIVTRGIFNFYDGTSMGITGGIDGTISSQETTIVNGTTVVSGKTYQTAYNS